MTLVVDAEDGAGTSGDLTNKLAGGDGASLIGTTDGRTVADVVASVSSGDIGVLPPGTVISLDVVKRFKANPNGNSDFRGAAVASVLNGDQGAHHVNALTVHTELQQTAGNVDFGYGIQGFVRTGKHGSTVGNVRALRGVEWHNAIEGSGNVASSITFYAHGIDLADGTGTVDSVIGFLTGDHGHADRINVATHGFYATNPTAGAPLTTAFAHKVSRGVGRWGFYAAGTANNAFAGAVRIGDLVPPTDKLEVNGFLKAVAGGDIQARGARHEFGSNKSGYVAELFSTHPETPSGLLVKFTAGAPNNRRHPFAVFRDSGGTKAAIWSDGGATFRGVVDLRGATMGGVPLPLRRTIKSRSGTRYLLELADAATYLRLNSKKKVSLTVPAHAEIAFPVGTVIEFEQTGKGPVNVEPDASVTVHVRDGRLSLAGQYAVASLRKVALNHWVLSGDLSQAVSPRRSRRGTIAGWLRSKRESSRS